MAFSMKPLPRIACFHGGGSTGRIFKVQCDQLIRSLASTYELVFFDAPFHRGPGPGVLPFFVPEKYGPYGTWFQSDSKDVERGDGRGGNDERAEGEGGVERCWRLLKEYDEQKRDEGENDGEWVGCMGFSQGTRVVGGLLLDQQRRRECGFVGDIEFKFGILCCGSAAPMASDLSNFASPNDVISIPTLHLHGLKDAQYDNGKKQMTTWFDSEKTVCLDIDYHHAMPWHRADLLKFADLMRDMLKNTTPKQ